MVYRNLKPLLCMHNDTLPLYRYDPTSMQAVLCEYNDYPWPVSLALCGFHKKHVMCHRKLPDMDAVGRSIAQFVYKLKWRILLKDTEPDPYYKLCDRKWTRPCNEIISERFGNEIQLFATECHAKL